jgi:hypothetical protein
VTESVTHSGRPVMVEKSEAEDGPFGRPVGIDASLRQGNRLPHLASDLALYRLGTDSFVVPGVDSAGRSRYVPSHFWDPAARTPAVNPRRQWVPTMSIVRIRRATLEGWSR